MYIYKYYSKKCKIDAMCAHEKKFSHMSRIRK